MDKIGNRTFDELRIGDSASIARTLSPEAGNILAEQLEYRAEAEVAGIVPGARVPIIRTSCADKTWDRLGSCAVTLLLVRHKTGTAS